jgi:hypothetical protein
MTSPEPKHGFEQSITLKLSPLATQYFVCSKELEKPTPKETVSEKTKSKSKKAKK